MTATQILIALMKQHCTDDTHSLELRYGPNPRMDEFTVRKDFCSLVLDCSYWEIVMTKAVTGKICGAHRFPEQLSLLVAG